MALISGILAKKILSFIGQPIFHCARRTATKQKPKKVESPFIIVRPDPEDYDDIVELMWNAYYKDEPNVKYLGLGKQKNPVFDEQAMQGLCQGLSLISKCKFDGCIVGGAINEGSCPWDPDLMDNFACTLSNVKMRQLYQFYAYIQRLPDLWKQACTPKIFEIAHIFVRPDDRGKGVGTDLVKQSIETATDCTYRCVRMDCTTSQSAHIAEKLGMKLIYEIPYCTYIGPNDRPVLDPPPPDTSLKVYVALPLALPKKK